MLCLILLIILLLPFLANGQQKNIFQTEQDTGLNAQKDPFEQPKLNFNTDTAAPLKPESDAFRLSASAIPPEVAPGESLTIRVRFEIAAGHQLYVKETSVKGVEMTGITFGSVNATSPVFEKHDQYLGKIPIYKKEAVFELPVMVDASAELGPRTILLSVRYLGCTETVCFLPETRNPDVSFMVVSAGESVRTAEPVVREDMPETEQNPFQKASDRFGALGVLIAAFIWGILASLTPCVYPMIPVTVSIIGAGSGGSTSRGFVLSVFYVLGLSLTYAIFGTIAAWSGGLFGEYANHPAVRIVVAAVFVILALGMFDLFYIQTPSSVSSRFSGRKGAGVVGVFLTGAAAGAVVGPCVGPMLVALLIYIAALGSKLQGFLIMWHFALGMGMLFLVIGTFSSLAASLPKAGAWMEKLKHFFGVLLIAAALYYVEPLMPENVFILITGIFLIGISVFTGAFYRVSPESPRVEKIWKTVGIVFLVLGVACIARFILDDRISQPRVVSPKQGIAWLGDEASALARARQENKPVMMDFRADWCTACLKLERETFTDPAVIDRARGFVPVKIDCTDTADPVVRNLQKKYGVVGLPTIIFMNSLGNPLLKMSVTEFVKPDTLLERMRQVE
ncbi:protein-disulfide reductase DsbD [Desulfococcaceae bacterium HSG8]|nr:protein-disulfide reductase DsbD [Desulfococcaceae bacterium HSG8]